MKSVVLLAGLGADGPDDGGRARCRRRDHTELMLQAAGARVVVRGRRRSASIRSSGSRLGTVEVPGDFSSAAPFIVAATLLAESRITIHDVNLNPRRTGLLDVLERMGAASGSCYAPPRRLGGGRRSRGARRPSSTATDDPLGSEVPLLIDELPLFALAAACAHGDSCGLRRPRAAPEGDRPCRGARRRLLRGDRRPRAGRSQDGFSVKGVPARPRGGRVEARGDHRIAMLGAVAGLVSREGVEIEGAESVAVSFPGFFELLDQS